MARILVADDEEAVRSYVSRALELHGFEVSVVADGGAALERLNDERFDLLLSDIVMPVMDGIALALKAGDAWPDMPVLLMTGYSAEQQRAHNLDALLAGVISKPFTIDQIVKAVRDALGEAD